MAHKLSAIAPNWWDYTTCGGNIAFCDGHAELLKQRNHVYSFELSEENDRTQR